MKFRMAPDSLLPLLFLSCFLLPFSAACSESFVCGDLGEIRFPFSSTRNPECGLLLVKGCDNSSAEKEVGLGDKGWFPIQNISMQKDNQSEIIVRDLRFQELLDSKPCSVFDYQVPIPSDSPTLSFSFLNRFALLRCDHHLINYNYMDFGYVSQHNCTGYNISYDVSNMDGHLPSPSIGCSTIQLLLDPTSTNSIGSDPNLTAEIHLQVRVSDYCIECHYFRGGQCLADGKCSVDGHKGIDSKALIIGVAIGSAGVIIIVLFIIFLLVKLQRYNCSGFLNQSRSNYYDIHPSTNPECVTLEVGVPIFHYEELQKATNNFDPSRELGHGGFGAVYYGKLRDGREVAVKRVYDHKRDKRVKQFMNEIEAFTRLRHRNLVSLYGCTSPQSHLLLLAYEYIPNGTVANHLYGDLAESGSLPWPLRMNIAVETATALTYLHACGIIHRDVKTNNILLDNNFCVKVADFGISRLSPNDVSHVSTAPQGTMGYMDPEYVESHQLTNKSDVYSFGVVLIELISSMPPVDQTRKEDEIKLANLAIKKIQRREIIELVDPSLGFESDNEYRRMIISVAELAFQCLQRDKELRPSMYKVLDELQNVASREDEPESLEIHGAGILRTGARTPPPTLPDQDEDGSVKKMQRLSLHRTLG